MGPYKTIEEAFNVLNHAEVLRRVNTHEYLITLLQRIKEHKGNINYETMFEWIDQALIKTQET